MVSFDAESDFSINKLINDATFIIVSYRVCHLMRSMSPCPFRALFPFRFAYSHKHHLRTLEIWTLQRWKCDPSSTDRKWDCFLMLFVLGMYGWLKDTTCINFIEEANPSRHDLWTQEWKWVRQSTVGSIETIRARPNKRLVLQLCIGIVEPSVKPNWLPFRPYVLVGVWDTGSCFASLGCQSQCHVGWHGCRL